MHKLIRRQDITFEDKDQPLRDDVRMLGTLVGELLKDQGGDELFDIVEAARLRAIRRREDNEKPGEDLATLVNGLDLSLAAEVIRAFSTYFQMVNTAEKVHRIRRRRKYLQVVGQYQPGGLEETLAKLKASGIDLPGLQKLLNSMLIEPVFTAHPTEPTRRTILRKEQHIVRQLIDMLNPTMTTQETNISLENIRLDMTTGWQTDESPSAQMTVADELEHVLFFLTDVLYKAMPPFYEDIENAVVRVYGEEGHRITVPRIVRFASWVGGDMDGNPNVNAKTIRSTLARQRSLILDLYFKECGGLSSKLSQSSDRIAIDEAIPRRIDYDDSVYPYESVKQFRDDIEILAASLAAHKGQHAGLFAVKRLIRRIETFGFHFLTLDVRQDALVHRQVVGELLGEDDWLNWSAEDRLARIIEVIESRDSFADTQSITARKTLAVFQAVAFCKRKYGDNAIGPFIISMTQGADDVLSVLLLANWSELHNRRGEVPVDIAPLLETVEDLRSGKKILEEMLACDLYRKHLRQRSDRQSVMIGYSDSNKDSGLASARWALQHAQIELVDVVSRQNIELNLFHGRGGTISRGGGKTHAAVMGAPPGTVNGRLRVTEQGEIINEKYGLRGIALRTLEQAVGSVALATAMPQHRGNDMPHWHDMMDVIASASRDTYRKLVFDTPNFHEYFRLATPIDLIERMRIGSRPASRRAGSGVENLRAIPWVFAWTQNRLMLPGWYGLGSGLQAASEQFEDGLFREMFSEWYFMRTLTADAGNLS